MESLVFCYGACSGGFQIYVTGQPLTLDTSIAQSKLHSYPSERTGITMERLKMKIHVIIFISMYAYEDTGATQRHPFQELTSKCTEPHKQPQRYTTHILGPDESFLPATPSHPWSLGV